MPNHTVIPQIGFFFSPSVGVPVGGDAAPERRGLKSDLKDKIEFIDPQHTKRTEWADLDSVEFDPLDGHIPEAVVKYKLGRAASELVDNDGGDSYGIGVQIEWCYAVRDQTIICYHCYGLQHDDEAVTVTAGDHSVTLAIYYSWELPLDLASDGLMESLRRESRRSTNDGEEQRRSPVDLLAPGGGPDK